MSSYQFYEQLAQQIKTWARELGFQQAGITDTDLSAASERLKAWLAKGYHGDMAWLSENHDKRTQPQNLLPGTLRVISLRMDYLPGNSEAIKVLKNPRKAYLARYALGRDYHKLMRKRLAKLAEKIRLAAQPLQHVQQRPFVDSAPVMERPLAEKAGLGWTGKHTLILNKNAGSWFFLGEIYTNLPLPVDNTPAENQCGECSACLKVCPTNAFPRPYELDARRCISYLTIENKGPIPEEFRQAMGNRVFGCDDCQAICPWNKYARPTDERDFQPRHGLEAAELVDLFRWDEATFLQKTQGSPIRRVGYQGWLRNLAVALGNAPQDAEIVASLQAKRAEVSPLVQEHIDWALAQQTQPQRRRRKVKAR